MKHSDYKIIPNAALQGFFGDFCLKGVPEASLVLFLCEALRKLNSSFFLSFESKEGAFRFFKMAQEFETVFLYYPEASSDVSVPGFNSEESLYRKESLIGLSSDQNFCCVGTNGSFSERNIPKGLKSGIRELKLRVNENYELSNLIDFLHLSGYSRTELVYQSGCYSNRGDVLDVYPKHFKKPFRLSFNFDTLESISTFNPLSQLTEKNHSFIVLKEFKESSEVVDNVDVVSFFSAFNRFYCEERGSFFHFFNNNTVAPNIFMNVVLKRVNRKTNFKKTFGEDVSFYLAGGELSDLKFFNEGLNVRLIGFLNSSFYIKETKTLVVSILAFSNGKNNHEVSKKEGFLDKNTLSDLSLGDFIVHKSFGVGLFRGVVFRDEINKTGESIKIEYNSGSVVLVSLDQLSLVHKYVGSKKNPSVSSLGSKKWKKEILKTKKAVRLFAKELIALYSEKNKKRGFLYSKENDLDGSLASSFSFVETPDQKKAIEDVFNDMNREKPMDRLICGDVGFGKTEVALRALFKCCLSNKVSILLCPTTILADQHFITCAERLGPLGVSVGLLSRFKSKKEQLKIVDGLKRGEFDVLVGTHRLLSDDVQIPNLSLLVIDEEHRFGVKHKEKIRSLKKDLDVLTLTATPIPRTLQQSLVGLRDLSTILTPPISRKPIKTSVYYFNWDLIFSNIDFELKRGGQVYFLHNDIKSIPIIINKIKNRFKNVVVGGISGKMTNKELEPLILSFFAGNIDVLVCTTIIESGLDVTNANTIIINNAQDFGLSQLYQIRGRVGRGKKQAICLLLIPQKKLLREAHLRLKALEENNALGSGYSLSVRDLEIRGAGSLFGYKQSGNISKVGFELYCEILEEEIGLEKSEKLNESTFSISVDCLSEIEESFIKERSVRLDFYFRLSKVKNIAEYLKIKENIIDRYGRLPKTTERLFFITQIKLLFKNTCVNKVDIKDRSLSLTLGSLGWFKTLENLFNSINSFESRYYEQLHYKKDFSGNLILFFSVKNIDRAFLVLFEIEPLFNNY